MLCLAISEEDVTLIMNTLKRDLTFLNDNSLMDYSVLLGIEKINNVREEGKSGSENKRFNLKDRMKTT